MEDSGADMNPFSSFGIPGFDPSKMDPKLIMELTQLVQQLPPEQLSRMQTLMHNAMAGFDTRVEMEEFEKSLPPGFREKIVALLSGQGAQSVASAAKVTGVTPQLDVREARITILTAVADGQMSPEEAEKILFS